MKLDNLNCNARMNYIIHCGALKFSSPHTNSICIEKWEVFKISYTTITQKTFKNTHLLPLYPLYIGTDHQACLEDTQQSNIEKADGIGHISKTSILPIYMEEVWKTNPMVILREKGGCIFSSNLLIRAATYGTVRTFTVLTLHQIKTVKRKMKRRRMVHPTNTPGEYDECRLNPIILIRCLHYCGKGGSVPHCGRE